MCFATEVSDSAHRMVHHPVLVGVADALLGPTAWLLDYEQFGIVYQDARPDPGSAYSRIGWHTDHQSGPHLDIWPGVAFTVHFDPTSPANGFLRVLPGATAAAPTAYPQGSSGCPARLRSTRNGVTSSSTTPTSGTVPLGALPTARTLSVGTCAGAGTAEGRSPSGTAPTISSRTPCVETASGSNGRSLCPGATSVAGQREIRREPVPLPGVHLYAAYLGGPLDDGRMGEDHEVVLVVAVDPGEAKSKAMAKWRGAGRGHLDALERIDRVDGHRVLVSEVADGDEGEERGVESFN